METMLADKYVLNFSVFQSLPDIWAIDQLFPILPIHRLNERPDGVRHARGHHLRLGRQDREVHRPARHQGDPRRSTRLRGGEPYYVGVCLMGAYQDVLGDLHNLFGEVNEVLVTVDEQGKAHIEDVLPGESCERVLEYMNYDRTGDAATRSASSCAAWPAGRSRRTSRGRSTASSRKSSRGTRTWSADANAARAGGTGPCGRAGRRGRDGAARRPPAPVKVWRVGVYESPPYAMHGADGQWRGLAIDLWKEIADRAEPAVPPRRGVARRHPRRHRHDRLDIVGGPVRGDGRSGAAARLHPRLPRPWTRGSRSAAAPTKTAGSTVTRALSTAVRAPALRRHRGPHVPRAGPPSGCSSAGATRSSRAALWQGLGSGFWWSGVTDRGRRLRRQGADHVLGTDRGPLLDVRQPHPRDRADGLRHGQARDRRVRPGARRRQPAPRRRRHARGLGGRRLPAPREDPATGVRHDARGARGPRAQGGGRRRLRRR